MEDEIEDVKTESSTVAAVEGAEVNQDVKEVGDASSQQTNVTTPESDVDEKGVPWKNREAEIRRKVQEEMQPFIQHQIQEGLKQYQSTQVEKPAQAADPIQAQLAPYNVDQLEGFAASDTQNSHLYRREINRRIKEETKNEVLSEVRGETRKQQFEREQQSAIGFLQQSFPDAFMNIGGQGMWNTGNPLVQKAFQLYNSDPAFKAHGSGLRAAFLQAKGEMALEDSSKIAKQKTNLTAQQRKLDKTQSGSMNAGGQSAPQVGQGGAKVKLAKLLEQHKKTGDPKVMAEILKMKNIMPNFE